MGEAQDAFNNDPANAGWHMNDHGSVVAIHDDVPPGESRTILRGNFSIVEYSNPDEVQTVLVLQGLEPENRKLVYQIDWFPGTPDAQPLGQLFAATKTQDSPGMARNGWEGAK